MLFEHQNMVYLHASGEFRAKQFKEPEAAKKVFQEKFTSWPGSWQKIAAKSLCQISGGLVIRLEDNTFTYFSSGFRSIEAFRGCYRGYSESATDILHGLIKLRFLSGQESLEWLNWFAKTKVAQNYADELNGAFNTFNRAGLMAVIN